MSEEKVFTPKGRVLIATNISLIGGKKVPTDVRMAALLHGWRTAAKEMNIRCNRPYIGEHSGARVESCGMPLCPACVSAWRYRLFMGILAYGWKYPDHHISILRHHVDTENPEHVFRLTEPDKVKMQQARANEEMIGKILSVTYNGKTRARQLDLGATFRWSVNRFVILGHSGKVRRVTARTIDEFADVVSWTHTQYLCSELGDNPLVHKAWCGSESQMAVGLLSRILGTVWLTAGVWDDPNFRGFVNSVDVATNLHWHRVKNVKK